MIWTRWYIVLSLLTSVRAFSCIENAGCSDCQIRLENVFEINCATTLNSVVEVNIRPNGYVRLTCRNSANWTNFHLGKSHPVKGVTSLSIDACNLPESNGLGIIAKQLFTDSIETLYFRSDIDHRSTLLRENLRDLSSLKKLTLTGLNLTIVSNDLFQDLPNLIMLNLQNVNLRYLPKNIFRSPNLEAIELSTNELVTLDSSSFGKLDRLRLLNIWNNKIVKIFPNTFDELASLEILGLQRNKLKILPNDLFVRLGNLRIVNLSQNNFTLGSLSADLLRNCSNLRSLVLVDNRRNITTLPNGFFANLTKLESVKLRKIGLISLPEDLFLGTINLRNLSIERNYLSTLPRKIFNDNDELSTLNLNFNELSSLPDDIFTNLRKLVSLDLSRNHLTIISEKLFSGLTSLRELNMEKNSIISMHFDALGSMRKLRVARFSHNSLTLETSRINRKSLESPFHVSEELEELYLDHNNISDIFVDWMYSMLSLRILNLSYNRLRWLTHEDLQFLSQDLYVDLKHNNISHVYLYGVERWAAERTYSRNLIVSIENNPIECDCDLYDLLRYFEGRLHHNVKNAFHLEIGRSRCSAPNELQNIAIIDMKSRTLECDTNMTEFRAKCPFPCTCYMRPENEACLINCANKGLTEAPLNIECLPGHSIELNLSGNSLTSIPNFDQPGYDKVAILALDNNDISEVSVDMLSLNLKVLKLNNNSFSRVDKAVIEFFENSTQLEKITLEYNPWLCDCEAREFFSFVQKKSVTMPELRRVTCVGKEKPIYEMTSEELCFSNIGWIIGGCILAFFGMFVSVVAALYYRYQREIKIWLYAKNWCLWLVTEEELDREKLFDAFISYSHKDDDFVENVLVPNLEAGPRPYKICVHYRNWMPGEWISKQIVRSVEESRRTIVVVSRNFLTSLWSKVEFRAAHCQALNDGRARIIVILYGEIGPIENLDSELNAYLTMNTYVKWGDPWFWEKLEYAMPHPTGFTKHNLGRNALETIQGHSIKINDSRACHPTVATPPINITPPTSSAIISFDSNDACNERENSQS